MCESRFFLLLVTRDVKRVHSYIAKEPNNEMKLKKIKNLDIVHMLLYYQAAGAYVPKAVHVFMASVLCLSIHTLETSTGEKEHMVNRIHSFLNYIWISDRKSSVPISSSPGYPSPIFHSNTPCTPQLRVLHIYGQTRGVVTFKKNEQELLNTYCMTTTQREEAHKRESGKATGRCLNILKQAVWK